MSNAKRARVTPAQYVDVLDTLITGREVRKNIINSKIEMKGLEVPEEYVANTSGSDILSMWDKIGLTAGYGDPAIDSVDLARQIRQNAENNRVWKSNQ
jgi:predicted AlkP superfamily phosphohydrolase/phosphomutase